MTNKIGKALIAIGSVISIGYGAECPLNEKLDEKLCMHLNDVSETEIVKFYIIIRGPVIEIPDKSGTDEEYSRFYMDSLSRYLDANKTVIYSLLNEHVLYKVDSSGSLTRLTESNVLMSLSILASGTRETILSLANASDFITRLEHYFESQPAVTEIIQNKTRYNLTWLNKGNIQKNICYDLKGRVVGKKTSIPKKADFTTTMKFAPSKYIVTVKDGKHTSKQNILILP